MWRREIFSPAGMLILVCLGLLALAPAASAEPLKIININVGHGDATLVLGATDTTGHRAAVLVDAGPVAHDGQDNGRKIAGVLADNGVRVLDYFIASHYDMNHLGGFVSGGPLGNSFMDGPDGISGTGDDIRVNFFVDRGDISDLEPVTENRVFEAYRDHVQTAGHGERVPLRFNHIQMMAHGCHEAISTQEKLDCFTIDLGDDAKMDAMTSNGFVRDGKGRQVDGANSENERSLTFLVTKDRFNFLVGGDLTGHDGAFGQPRENARLERALGRYLHKHGIRVDVLHVNGHGSPHASEWQFLKLVRPKVAVISVGHNGQTLPSASALSRLVDVGVLRIYQTNPGRSSETLPLGISERQVVVGDDIVITTDGNEYHVVDDRYKTNP